MVALSQDGGEATTSVFSNPNKDVCQPRGCLEMATSHVVLISHNGSFNITYVHTFNYQPHVMNF